MIHVCYLSHTAELRGGAERSLIELVHHVSESGRVRASLVSPPGPLAEALRPIATVYLEPGLSSMRRTSNPVRLVSYGARFAAVVRKLRRRLDALRPDVVHANSAPAALYAVAARGRLRIPVVWHMRDIQAPHRTFRLVLPALGRRADRIVAISHAVRTNLESFGVDPAKILVYHNAVQPVRLEGGGAWRERHGIAADETVIGVVGQLLHRKGQRTAVRAFERVSQKVSRTRLVLCGGNLESDYAAAVRSDIARLGMGDRVLMTGFEQDPGPLFDAMDLLVVPSNQEPFGRVVAEAMLAGKPLVATCVGGIPELVRDGQEALLVAAGDAEAMAGAILRLIHDPALAGRLATAARQRAQTAFGWVSRDGHDLLQIYDHLAVG